MNSVTEHPDVAHLLRDILDQLADRPTDATLDRLRPWLPYCLYISHGQVLPLNRNYKPLGHSGRDWVDYDEPTFDSLRFDARLVSWLPGELDGKQLYLTRSFYLRHKHYRDNYLSAARRLLGPLLRTCKGDHDVAA
mgnify:CR=1 FL=1